MNAVGDTTVTLEDDHEKFDGVQDPARNELFLVKACDPETSPILYYKYESLDPMVSDTRHEASSPWWEQTTGTPELLRSDGEYDTILTTKSGHEVNIDDGFILDFHGTPTRTVAIDQNGDVLDEAQSRAREQVNGRRLRRYTEWGFRLHKATLTDGPDQRFQLLETEKVQRERAEGKMAGRLEQVFSTLITKMGGSIDDAPTSMGGPSSADELMSAFDTLTDDPRQREALREHLLAELETKAPPAKENQSEE